MTSGSRAPFANMCDGFSIRTEKRGTPRKKNAKNADALARQDAIVLVEAVHELKRRMEADAGTKGYADSSVQTLGKTGKEVAHLDDVSEASDRRFSQSKNITRPVA